MSLCPRYCFHYIPLIFCVYSVIYFYIHIELHIQVYNVKIIYSWEDTYILRSHTENLWEGASGSLTQICLWFCLPTMPAVKLLKYYIFYRAAFVGVWSFTSLSKFPIVIFVWYWYSSQTILLNLSTVNINNFYIKSFIFNLKGGLLSHPKSKHSILNCAVLVNLQYHWQ